uniref:Uncharacterized protein n=1 Tax=Phialocephala uotiloensis TaxID=1105056 RepID=G8G1D3_9HELO|nr:hypothetical protein ORF_01 [Phialocephala uotiloensis]
MIQAALDILIDWVSDILNIYHTLVNLFLQSINITLKLPFFFLTKGASEATLEEIAREQAKLRQAYKDKEALETERKPLDEAHSKAGDNDSIDENILGEQLEEVDGLIIETLEHIGNLISWLGS